MSNSNIFPPRFPTILQTSVATSIHAGDAGQFISRGMGSHPNRILNVFDLIYIQSGVLGVQEEETPFEVKAGESLLLWPGRRHWGTTNYTQDLVYFWLHFDLQGDPGETQAGANIFAPQHVAVARPGHLIELFRRYLDDQESPDRDQMTANLTVGLMLCEIARSIRMDAEIITSRSMLSEHAKQFIQANSHLPITTASVAKAIDVNPNYLSRIFRRDFGMTVTDAIHQSRMSQARFYLVENSETVDAIARRCGYESAIYFRRVFHRIHGITPLEYRRLYLKAHVIGY